MLQVQEYLISNSVESLEKIGVFAKYHPTKPWMILDYDQIEASKHKDHPIVKECRGLVLRTDDFTIIHKAFDRFFNINESDCTNKFDWTDFSTSTKEDGSLIKLRWYEGEFVVTTRNSFADSQVGESGKSWFQLVHQLCTDDQIEAVKVYNCHSFNFELCTPHNTVVVNHPEPKLVLLSIFNCETGEEWSTENVDFVADQHGFIRPETFYFKTFDEVVAHIDNLTDNKSDTEGVVLKDCNGVRLKFKSSWYIKLHKLSGNGNIKLIKNSLPIVLEGEQDEVLSYFPYLKDHFAEIEKILADLFADFEKVWFLCQDFEEQKRFALYITRDNPTPFSSILFRLKKEGKIHDFEALKHEWHQSANLILKYLKED